MICKPCLMIIQWNYPGNPIQEMPRSQSMPLPLISSGEGGKDEWTKLAELPAGVKSYTVDLQVLPASQFYKFVVVSPGNHLNRWLQK